MPYLLFFSSHFGHRKVLDRVQSAVDAGLAVHLVCYDRFDIGGVRSEVLKLCDSVTFIGKPQDGGKLTRLFYWFVAFLVYLRIMLTRGIPSFVLVNNGEFLLFASLLYFGSAKKFFDLADVHRIQYGQGIKSKLYRFVERFALKRGWLLVVTSPWFYWNYFVTLQRAKNRAFLIENKLGQSEFDGLVKNQVRSLGRSRPLIIGWTGVLRCSTSLRLLLDLCDTYPGTYQLHLIGMMGTVEPKLEERAMSNPHVVFKGKYGPKDLGVLLSDVDYVWCADFDDGLNSKLLLPNRLYQAICGVRPLVAYSDSATGFAVTHSQVGLTFNSAAVEGLHLAFASFDMTRYELACHAMIRLRSFMVRKDEFRKLFSASATMINSLPHFEDVGVLFNPIFVVGADSE